MRARYLAVVLAMIIVSQVGAQATTEPSDGIEAISQPSGDVKLAFVEPGLIADVLVKESQTVKVGEVLMQQDDAVRLAELEALTADATDTTRVEAAEAQLEQKKVDLKKLKDAGPGGASPMEVEHAALDVTIGELQLKLERYNLVQNGRKAKEAKLRIDRMKIVSPIAGKVEQLAVKKGESVEALAQVIRVVNVDPLWVDVPMPLAQAAGLQQALDKGSTTVNVCFPGQKGEIGAGATCQAKVVHVAMVADPGSNKRIVRIEVPNPELRPAGEHVMIKLMPTATPVAAKK